MRKIPIFLLSVFLILFLFVVPGAESGLPGTTSSTVIIALKDGRPAPSFSDPHAEISYSDDSFIILDYTGTDKELNDFLEAAASLDEVLYVEQDTPLSASALTSEGLSGTPTDDYFAASEYWFDNTGSYSKFSSAGITTIGSVRDIDIDGPEGWEAYRLASPTRRAVVALIDTGIDYRHPDLSEAMWVNKGEIPANGLDDDGNGYIDDIYGWDFYNDDSTVCHYEYDEAHDTNLCSPSDNDNHGTHCAGIIAARADNSIGVAGVASAGDVKLMALKVYGGSDCSGTVAGAIKAIRYADRMGADVCNISWGFYKYSSTLYAAISRSNMLFVCAAGNDGSDNDENPIFPASYDLDNVISVGYLTEHGDLASGSNYGASTVDVAVPAKDIFSTIVGSYASMNGSSMAAPQVSGIAALLYTFGDGMYASNVRDIILSGVKPVPDLDKSTVTGGIPSLKKAISSSDRIIYDTESPSMNISLSYPAGDLLLSFDTFDEGGSGAGNLRYFTGRRNLAYFAHGTEGTAVADNALTLSKSGKYTFYLSDYAGNEIIRTLMIPDDVLAPTLSDLSVSVNNKMTKLTVSAYVADSQSGLRSVKYLKGIHSTSDFLSGSDNDLIPDEDGRIKFSTPEEGTYTIYVCDNRGNSRVTEVYAYIRKAVSITLSKKTLSLTEGKTKRLKATLTPASSTDRITFASSDTAVAEITAQGAVTAIAPGECIVTATTSSGKTAVCKIKVKASE